MKEFSTLQKPKYPRLLKHSFQSLYMFGIVSESFYKYSKTDAVLDKCVLREKNIRGVLKCNDGVNPGKISL